MGCLWCALALLAAMVASRPALASDDPGALWLDLPIGFMVPNTSDANRSVERYGGKLGATGVGIGFLPSLRVKSLVVGLHFFLGGTKSSRDATYELTMPGGGSTPASSALGLSHSEVGIDLGYVVWSTERAFLYPIVGFHRYDESADWSNPDHPGQFANAMSKAGLGLFAGLAIQRSLDLSGGRARTFVGARVGTLFHLAKADLQNSPANFEAQPSFGAVQSAVIMFTLGIGDAQP
jgi:hypothetical protein